MNNTEKVSLEYYKSRHEWPYARLFAELKNAGVKSYETNAAHYNRIFYGPFETWTEEKPQDHQTIDIKGVFSLECLQQALKLRQENETTYREFLREIAASGVATYEADMIKYTITYYNASKSQSFVQQVLEWL